MRKIAIDCKILALLSTGISGYFRPLLKELIYRFKDCTFYLIAPREFEVGFLGGVRNWEIVIVPFIPAPKEFIKNILYGIISLPRTLKKLNADLIVSPYYDFVIPPNYYNKSIITVHDLCFWDIPMIYPTRTKWFHYNILPMNLKRAAKVITVSKFSKERIGEVFWDKIKKPDIEIVYNSFDLKWFHTNIQENEIDTLQHRLGVSGKRCLIYSGGFDPRKNIENMLMAIGLLVKEQDDVRLLFTGNYQNNSTLKRLIIKNHLERHVILTGHLRCQELSILYREICIGAFNLSLYEGFGRNNLEAKYSGLPILCSDIPVTREVVGNYPVYCNPKDIHSIYEGICTLLHKGRMRSEVKPDDRFDFTRNTEKFAHICEGVLNGK